MSGDGENMFGRDSDSDSSDEAKDVGGGMLDTEEDTAPTGGGAAGGFLGQSEGAVARQCGSERGGAGGAAGGATAAEGEGKDATLAGEYGGEGSLPPPPPPPSQGGAQPKKTLPRPTYEGKAGALVEVLEDAEEEGEEPDIAKVRELLDAGIDVRYTVRISCAVGVLVVEY